VDGDSYTNTIGRCFGRFHSVGRQHPQRFPLPLTRVIQTPSKALDLTLDHGLGVA